MPRERALRNTCHGPRTSLQQRSFHPTDHVQQDIHPTDNQPPLSLKSGAGEGSDDDGGGSRAQSAKSVFAGDAVLRTSTRGTVPMGQCVGCHRGQHLTVHISTNDLHCLKPARRWHHIVRSTPTLPPAPPPRPPRHVPRMMMITFICSCRNNNHPTKTGSAAGFAFSHL